MSSESKNKLKITGRGTDALKVELDAEGCIVIAHGGDKFVQILLKGMNRPITVTTQIDRVGGNEKNLPRFEDGFLQNDISFRKKW